MAKKRKPSKQKQRLKQKKQLPKQKKTKSNDGRKTVTLESKYENYRGLGFSTFREHALDLKINFAIIDGLYHKTVLNKIIRKYTSSIVPPYFTLSVEDEEGNDLPELRKQLKDVSRKVHRKLLLRSSRQNVSRNKAWRCNLC